MGNSLSTYFCTGIIYKLTSPSGKEYVGKTLYTFEKRWKEHIKEANLPIETGCRYLNKAIKKYGADSFKYEIILYLCDKKYLGMWEKIFIKRYNTLAPNGYNLQTGDNSNKQFSYITIQKMRETALKRNTKIYRKSFITKDLPKYVLYINNKDRKGYKIDRHPLCRSKYFCNPHKTDEENLQLALEYLKKLNSGQIVHKTRIDMSLPKGIQKAGYGYRVLHKGHIKTFKSKKIPQSEHLKCAEKCLKEFQEKYKD